MNLYNRIKNFRYAKFKKSNFSLGFTLVEMMVVVAIIIIVTSVILLKQSKFSSDILVTNAAYEVALSIRQAQVYGISSKQTTSNLNAGYGIYLDNALIGGSPSSFEVYSDNDPSYPFNFVTNNSEYAVVDNPNLTQGQTIKRFCVVGGTTGNACSDSSLTKLNIGFIKPKPEAIIHDSGSNTSAAAIIVIASALGDKCRVVRVTSIGQISVDAPKSDGSDCSVSS